MARNHQWMAERYEMLVSGGLNWEPPTLESASEPECTVDGQRMIMLSANNYLNLTTHPKVISAMIEATEKYGAGSGSVCPSLCVPHPCGPVCWLSRAGAARGARGGPLRVSETDACRRHF